MKFLCSKQDISEALQVVSKATGSGQQKTILECILIEAKDGRITMYATDTLMSARTSIPADIDEEGVSAIPARLMIDVVSKLPDSEIAFESSGQQAVIKCEKAVVKLSEADADTFPEFPVNENETVFEMEGAALKKLIDMTLFSVSQSDDNPVFTGENIEIADGRISIVASDTYRLAMASAECGISEGIKALVPSKAMREIARIAADESVSVGISEKALTITSGSTKLYSRLLEGEYIDYKKLIRSHDSQLRIDTRQLRETIERVSVVSRSGKEDTVRIKTCDDKLHIFAMSEYGDMTDEVPIYHEGGDIELSFRTKNLTDALRVIDDDEILVRFSSYVCTICPVAGDSYIYIIMALSK